jgi:hypothetical protein
VDDRIVAVDESNEVVVALQKQNAEPQERARILLQIIRKGALMEVILVS